MQVFRLKAFIVGLLFFAQLVSADTVQTYKFTNDNHTKYPLVSPAEVGDYTSNVYDSTYITTLIRSDNADEAGVSSGFMDPAVMTASTTYTVTLSKLTNVTSFQIGEFINNSTGDNYVFTPNVGTPITIADNSAAIVGQVATLSPTDWNGISSYTVSYAGVGNWRTGVDNMMTTLANNSPTSNDISVTTNEDTSHLFEANDFNYTDSDDGDSVESLYITTLPTKGKLTLSDTNVTLNQQVTVANIPNLKFIPVANGNGTPYDSFAFKVNDGDANSTSAYTATINVTSIDDAPVLDAISNIQNIENNGTTSITLNANDDDGDTIGYTAASLDTTKATVAIVDGKVVVTPIKNATGTVTIEVNAIANGKVTTKTFTVDLIDAPITQPSGLIANKWNMISIPKGKVLDTTTIDSNSITSGKAIKVYREGAWIENPTNVTAKEALWVHPTGTSIAMTFTDDTTNNLADKTAQLAYYKTLSPNTWHFVGVQYSMEWSDLTKAVITPDSCEGYTFMKYYDGANDSWNTTTNIPAGSGVWLRHLCK